MVDLYLDTEFNGHGGELISLGMVSPCGRIWYAAKCLDTDGGVYDPWVQEHVIPVLGTRLLLPGIFKKAFLDFIEEFDNPTIICDWHADAAHFLSLLEGPDYGSSLDYACNITILKTPPAPKGPVSRTPHNALADAVGLMEWHGGPAHD
jgi:hypothetical protein